MYINSDPHMMYIRYEWVATGNWSPDERRKPKLARPMLPIFASLQRVIARLLVFESDRNSQIARSPLLPQAEIEANGSVNQYNFQSIEHGPRQDAGPFHVIGARPTFAQTIFNLPLIRGYQIGREGTRQSRADEVTTRENVVPKIRTQHSRQTPSDK